MKMTEGICAESELGLLPEFNSEQLETTCRTLTGYELMLE